MEMKLTCYAPETLEAFKSISTATLTTLLFKKGLRNVWMRGPAPVHSDVERIAGPAFTLRFVPAREDLATPAAWSSPTSTRAAVEAMPKGSIAVVDAMGNQDAGIFGDILCQRMAARQVTGLVTDGVVRDIEGVANTGLPVWSSGVAAPPAVASLTFAGWNDPIGCGGVAVYPDDLIVADKDGAVVIPKAFVEELMDPGREQEQLEQWILEEVQSGAELSGLYPPNDANLARYRNSKD